MSCEPEKVTAYVDGALPPQERAQVEEHVLACSECHAQADFERDLRRRLSALRPPPPSEMLEARVQRRVRKERGGSWVRRYVPLAAALAILAVWAHGAPAVVATQLAWDHAHCFGKATLPAKMWTGDAERMASWLEHEGTHAPSLPERVAGLEMVGARYCPLADRRVAHLYYTGGDRRLSIYVVPGWVRLDRSQQVTRGDKTVRILRAGGATVGLVSEQPEAVEAFERALTVTMARQLESLLSADQ